MTELMSRIVQAAANAPSPDNNQPWKFVTGTNRLVIRPDQSRGLPSDVGDMYMYMALGAAAENACVAAREGGLRGDVKLVAADTSDQAVEILFSQGAESDPLFPYLEDRCTSRRWYSTRPLESTAIEALTESIHSFDEMQLDWIADRRALRQLAPVIAQGDLLRLQHQPFHEELYKQLRFSRSEVEETRDGLDVKTLELPPGSALMLRGLSRWSRMQTVHRLGLGGLLAMPSAMAVKKSGAVAVLSVPTSSAAHYLTAGRALQRLWLAATEQQLSLQPLGSLPIFFAHLSQRETNASELDSDKLNKIETLQQKFVTIAPATAGRVLVMLVRLGYGSPPTARALRRRVEDLTAV